MPQLRPMLDRMGRLIYVEVPDPVVKAPPPEEFKSDADFDARR